MAVHVVNRKGNKVTLLNPKEKTNKAFAELKAGIRCTNDQKIKRDKNGKPLRLTEKGRAFRSGYITAIKDCRGAYKSRQKKSQKIVYLPPAK